MYARTLQFHLKHAMNRIFLFIWWTLSMYSDDRIKALLSEWVFCTSEKVVVWQLRCPGITGDVTITEYVLPNFADSYRITELGRIIPNQLSINLAGSVSQKKVSTKLVYHHAFEISVHVVNCYFSFCENCTIMGTSNQLRQHVHVHLIFFCEMYRS